MSSRPSCELLADPRGAFGWYPDYDGVLRGAWRDYLTLETAASKISAYEAQRVPGLLQTPAYARALAEADPSLKDDAARRQRGGGGRWPGSARS